MSTPPTPQELLESRLRLKENELQRFQLAVRFATQLAQEIVDFIPMLENEVREKWDIDAMPVWQKEIVTNGIAPAITFIRSWVVTIMGLGMSLTCTEDEKRALSKELQELERTSSQFLDTYQAMWKSESAFLDPHRASSDPSGTFEFEKSKR